METFPGLPSSHKLPLELRHLERRPDSHSECISFLCGSSSRKEEKKCFQGSPTSKILWISDSELQTPGVEWAYFSVFLGLWYSAKIRAVLCSVAEQCV